MNKITTSLPHLNIGILGSGFMGKMRSHAYTVIKGIFDDLEITPRLCAVASIDDNHIEDFARRFGYQRYSNDWREVVNDPEIDVINICLPEYLHEETSIAALEAGKHVFCEKALSLSVKECQSMVKAADISSRISMVGFNYRFLPAIQFARSLIKNQVLGDIFFAECRYFQDSGHDPDWPAEKVKHSLGDRPLGTAKGLGSHVADTLRFLVGDFQSVQAIFKTFIPIRKTHAGEEIHITADDFATMTVEFDNGAVGVISTSKVATGRKNQMRLEVNGTKGSIVFDVESPNLLHIYLENAPTPALRGFTTINTTDKSHPLMEYWWPPGHNLGWEHSHVNEIHHFVKCIQLDVSVEPLGATFNDGLEAIRLIENGYISSREAQRIKL